MERRAGTRQGWSPACFNPRSRVGSDDRIFGNEVADHVSIHAPAWGATADAMHRPRHERVSIHAPAWGATNLEVNADATILFQSTLPRGERLGTLNYSNKDRQFQSTLPRGERHPKSAVSCITFEFQSTLPRGERPMLWLGMMVPTCFNPRSRVGSDLRFSFFSLLFVCFNPRSRVGSDTMPSTVRLFFFCFNPRSRVGSDSRGKASELVFKGFNPRSRVGSDQSRK